MNINMNLSCEHQELSLFVLLAYLVHYIEPPDFLVVHEQPQFHEHGLGTFS